MNRLNALPRGFGAFPALEVLDATYNNLSERSFPANFFMLGKETDSWLVCLTTHSLASEFRVQKRCVPSTWLTTTSSTCRQRSAS